MQLGRALAATTATLLVLAPASASAQATPGSLLGPIEIGGSNYVHEPFLFYDVTGSTIAGPIHISMAIYNDGFVSYGSTSLFADSFVSTVSLPPATVLEFARELGQAGASTLQDNVSLSVDLPTSTVSFLRPVSGATANTFSFAPGGAGHGSVTQLINDFVAQYVPQGTASASGGGSSGVVIPVIGFPFVREPVLVYDVTGSTLLGPVHVSLKVYNDGLVSYVSRAQPILGGTDLVHTTLVPVSVVEQLTLDLDAAGADVLPDSILPVFDIPVSTVSFAAEPGTKASIHTFSWLGGTTAHQAVGAIVNAFIQDHVQPTIPSP